MLDFLFSTEESMTEALSSALLAVAVNPDRPTQVYSGDWGCLTIAGQAYPCFDPVETDRYIVVVLAGPLPRHNFSVATNTEGDNGSEWILQQWKIESHLRWDEDLVGHFGVICVDKDLGHVEAVTDINSFVPLYATTLKDRSHVALIGSHVDALASAADRFLHIDEVSVADFTIHSTVTYPHTLYRGVRQLPPASVHRLAQGELRSEPYWIPKEQSPPGSFDECVGLLRTTLVRNIDRICSGQPRVGLLMSGGEDARVVASAAADATHLEGFTVVDMHNREARIASRVADQIGFRWHGILRTKDHYLVHLERAMALSESQNFFLHAHLNGFAHHLPPQSRVLGGLMADAFWKGSHIRAKGFHGFRFSLSIDRNAWELVRSDPVQWPGTIGAQLDDRRSSRNRALRAARPSTWAEWHSLAPASMNHNLSFLFTNRRLFPSYEPFVDAKMVVLSASVPQSWKINRRLFHAAMKPLLHSTRQLPHSTGFYPYRGLIVNVPLAVLWAARKRLQTGVCRVLNKPQPSEGPWPVWRNLAASELFHKRVTRVLANRSIAESPLWAKVVECTSSGVAKQRFRALQMLEWADWQSRLASNSSAPRSRSCDIAPIVRSGGDRS